MRSLRDAMQHATRTAMASGDGQPWRWLYHALVKVERAASWAKIKTWKMSLRQTRSL